MINTKLISSLCFLLVTIGINGLFAQENGLPTPAVWLRADNMGNNPYEWQDVSGNANHAKTASPLSNTGTVNYNPAVDFSGFADSLTVNYNTSGKEYVKVYCVFENETDSMGEQLVWRLGNTNEYSLQLSNTRIYDYPKVYNYSGGDISQPVISSVDKYGTGTIENSKIYMSANGDEASPRGQFKGRIAELLAYDAPTSRTQHNSIASYLAFKYGVTVYGQDYTDSEGNTVWGFEENSDYGNAVFAIGKDETFGLDQKQSTSTSENLIAISTGTFYESNSENPFDMENLSFMVFGNNGGETSEGLSLETERTGSYYISNRQWKVVNTGENIYRAPLSIKVKTEPFFEDSPENLLLVKDENADGLFSKIETTQADSIINGYAYFSNVNFGTSNTYEDYFTLAVSSPMEARANYTPPVCPGTMGTMAVQVTGATLPLTCTLYNESNGQLDIWEANNLYQTISPLTEGEYRLKIIDADNNQYALETGTSLSAQAPDLGIQTIYSFSGNPIDVDICDIKGLEIASCKWENESGLVSGKCDAVLNEEGTYNLMVNTTQGCELKHEFVLLKRTEDGAGTTNLNEPITASTIGIAPNPAPGRFRVSFNFANARDVTVHITDITGIQVLKEELKNIQEYILEEEIETPGLYIISIISGDQQLFTKKLIVK